MDFSIGNLSGTNANISSMISQLIAKRTSSMNSLLEQKTSIENALASLQNSSLGIGSINNSYSSQIASLQDTIDTMKEQYTINSNKLSTISSLNKNYNKTVTTLDDYIQSLKNPNQNDSTVSGTSSNGNVAGVTVENSANPQRIELSVSQLATCSVLTSGVISGTAISGSTKITDLFAGNFDSASNTLTSLRTDITEDMRLSELGVKSGSFKLGSRVITVNSDEAVGELINKINADSNYIAKIDRATGAFTISAKSGSSVAITNAVGDLNVSGNLTTTTKLEDIGVKSGAYFVGGVQIDVADGDTVGMLIDKLEAEGFSASIQTDTANPSSKVLSITDSSGNKVNTEATNFASAAGFTVSEGSFSINGESFTINSDTTIDDLLFEINKATDDGVGAIFKDGKIVLTASKTGAVEINVEKGSSNFTNAVGFTTGGVMNTGNLVLGSDGSYVTLKGLNSGIKTSDTAKSDGSGKFTTGNFLVSYSKIDDLGNATSEMLTTEIVVEDGDTIDDIIQKIKDQTTQTYTDSEGTEKTNYLQAEIVNEHFQIRQTAKGADYDISVQAGSSDFTNYVGLTKEVGTGVSTSGSATTYTGINAVTSSTKFTEGSFKITASRANSPDVTETVTIEVGENETLQSVMNKINNSGLAIRAELVNASDGSKRLQLSHNNYGSGYQISVEAGDTNFTNVVGFTTSVSVGVSSDGTASSLTGSVSGLNANTTGYEDGSFVISTNILSSDGKTASSQTASAIIEVDSSMSLQDVMDEINSATYKDADGNDVDLGLRASLTSDGKIKITQVNGGEGFDISVEAGDTNFTQEVGLTRDVTVGVSTGSTSTYVMGTTAYSGTFTEGSFKISTNKVADDGTASSEMQSIDVNIQSGKTLAQQLDSINAQLNTVGLSASIIADGANAGKIKIEQLNSGSDFDIQIEAGSTDFTEKLGLTSQVSAGVSNDGTYAYVLGKNNLSSASGYTAGDFTITTNKTDADGNPLDEMQSVTVTLESGLSSQNVVNSINSQISSIGLSASIENGKIKISQTNAGSGFDIKIEAGSTNFTKLAGLTKDVTVGTSTEGTATQITGNKNVTVSQNGFSEGSFVITSGKTGAGESAVIDVTSTDTIQSVINKINASGLEVNAYVDANGKFVIEQDNAGSDYFITVEAGNTDFTQQVGITANVSTGVSNAAENATLTGTIGNLSSGMTFSGGEFVITTNDVTHNSQEGYYADPNNMLSATISVSDGDTLQQVINKINQQGASIGISAALTSDGKIQLSQLNGGSGFTISVTAGSTDFTEKVGLTSTVSAGVSSSGTFTNITGTNTISVSDVAGVGHIDKSDAVSMGYTTVSTAQELVNALTSGADKIMLTDNIDMSGVDYTTIGTFSGVFDGNGYCISNLTINRDDNVAGLFSSLDGAVVRNVGFVNADIKGVGSVGVLAAAARNSTISNVYVKDSSVNTADAGTYIIGALIGFTQGDVTINNTVVENTTLDGVASSIGGVVGFVDGGNLSISNSAVVDITLNKCDATIAMGGFVGYVGDGKISVSDSIANFEHADTSDTTGLGSIVGMLYSAEYMTLDDVVSLSNLDFVYSGSTGTGVTDVESHSYNDFASVTTDLSGIKFVKDDSSASGYKIVNDILLNTVESEVGIAGTFTTGSFTITAGKSGSETTAEITVEDNDTVQDVINKINSAGLGVTASVNADGKFEINSDSADPDFRIEVESGSSNFLAYAGMVSEVQNIGTLTPGSDVNQFTTLTGSSNVTASTAITAGSFKINGVTIDLAAGGMSAAINKINTYTSQTGVIAEAVQNDAGKYNVVLRADKTGSGTTIYVEGGTSNFGVVSGLTTQSLGGGAALGTEGTKQTITGSKEVVTHLSEAEAVSKGYTVIHNTDEFYTKINADLDGKFMLMCDIFANEYEYISDFSGTLDGNGYTISNLGIGEGSSNGLFYSTSGDAVIKNLNIKNFYVGKDGTIPYSNLGLLVDSVAGNLTLENITVSNSRVAYASTVGLVGELIGELTADNIYIDSTVSFGNSYGGGASYAAGSIVGISHGSLVITNVESYAEIYCNNYVGGIAGYIRDITVDASFLNILFAGSITAGASMTVGGIVGQNDLSSNAGYYNIYVSVQNAVDASTVLEGNGASGTSNIYYNSDYIEGGSASNTTALNTDMFNQYVSYRQFYASPYTQISAGTVKVNGTTITLTAGTVEDAVSQINAKSSQTGVTASVENGKVVFSADRSFTIAEGTSDFVEKTGTAGYTVNSRKSGSRGDIVTGTVDFNKISETEASTLGYTTVKTASELKNALQSNKNVVLMNDIDISSLTFNVTGYTGVINGNGYTLKNARSSLISAAGDGVVIKNLKIDGAIVTSGEGASALLVEYAGGSISFENIEVTNSTLDSHYSDAGILLGCISSSSLEGNVVFNNIKIASSVSITPDSSYGATSVGALAGSTENMNVHVTNVESYASINAQNYIGGLIGTANNAVFNNVKVGGSIYSALNNTVYAGGFVGVATGKLTFKNSYAAVFMSMSDSIQVSSGAPLSYRDPSVINQFVGVTEVDGTRSASNNSIHNYIDSYYYMNSSAFSIGEYGTNADLSVINAYEAFDDEWAARKVSLTAEEAEALGYTVISSASEFRSKITADLDGKFMLVGDIDLSTVSYSMISSFNGTLDGNGYTIKNFTSTSSRGLFYGTKDGATFKNITLDNINITYSSGETGLLVGVANGDITFENIHVKNSSVNAYSAGALIGNFNYKTYGPMTATINNVYIDSSVSITGEVAAGGVVGQFAWTYGDGNGSHLFISNVSSYASVTATGTAAFTDGRFGAGGIVGSVSVDTVIDNVMVKGSVTGAQYAGGILGGFWDDSANTNCVRINVSNAYSLSSITSQNASLAAKGAFIGKQTDGEAGKSDINVENSYYYYSDASDRYADSSAYTSSAPSLADARGFYESQYFTYWRNNSSSDAICINNFYDVYINNGDSINTIIGKINELTAHSGVTASISDGKLTLSSDKKFTVMYSSNNLKNSLSIAEKTYGTNILKSSVTGLSSDMKLEGLSAGSLKIESQNKNYSASVNIYASDTLGNIINRINATGKFRASIDSEGRFCIEDLNPTIDSFRIEPGLQYFNVNFSDTNLENILGLGNYSSTFDDESVKESYNTLTGSTNVSGNETLDAGMFTLYLGDTTQNFTVNQGETINSVIDKINASSIGISAMIENNKLVLITNDETPDNIALKEVSGNFGTVSGLTTITNYGGESIVGHEGAYTTLTGSGNVVSQMTKAEAEAKGYIAVSTAAELRTAMYNSDASKTIVLVNDIDMSSFGRSVTNFAGTIDGNGYTLKNYSSSNYGIISSTSGAVTIKNLNIDNFNVNGSTSYLNVALLIKSASHAVTIDSVNVTNSYVYGYRYTGALIGSASSKVDISNVTVDKNTQISASSAFAGGLIGSVTGVANISNVYSASTLGSYGYTGGLVASVYSGTVNVNDVYIGSEINTSSAGSIGGIIGKIEPTYNGSVLNTNNVVINADFTVNRLDPDTVSGSFTINLVSPSDISGTSNRVFYNADKLSNVIKTTGATDALTSQEITAGFDPAAFVSKNYTQVSAGTVNVNGLSIILSGGSLGTALNEINAYSAKTGVTASVENGKVVFKNNQYGSNAISVTEGTSNFTKVTGTAGYSTTAAVSEQLGGNVIGTGLTLSLSTHYTASEASSMGYTTVSSASALITALQNNTQKIMLTSDISLGGYSNFGIENFTGILDGNGYTISDLSCTLFKSTGNGAVIRNLNVSNAIITTSDTYAAVLVGRALGSVTFENINISDLDLESTASGSSYTGALVGFVKTYSAFVADNIFISGHIGSNSYYLGGLAGAISSYSKAVVKNVSTELDIVSTRSGTSCIGGMIGSIIYADVVFENTYGLGLISCSGTGSIGGFIGRAYSIDYISSKLIFKDTFSDFVIDADFVDDTEKNSYIGSLSIYANAVFDNALYYDNNDSTGEQGTATINAAQCDGYDSDWTARPVLMTERGALAQGYTIIRDAQDFVSKINADKDGKFILMGDIDLSTISFSGISGFAGTLDGNGFTIKNFKKSSGDSGLFSTTSGSAVIKNLTLDGFNINTTSGNKAGALIAYVTGDVTIDNVTLKNSSIKGGTTGGLIGSVGSYQFRVDINNVCIDSTVSISSSSTSTTSYTGGIIGHVTSNGLDTSAALNVVVKNSVSNATISASGYAAQIIGCSVSSTMIHNVSTGGSIQGYTVGSIIGLVSQNGNHEDDFISNVYTSTELTATSGGSKGIFVGKLEVVASIVMSYYNSSTVNATDNCGSGSTATAQTQGITSYSSSDYDTVVNNEMFNRDGYQELIAAGTVVINGVTITLQKGTIQDALSVINEYTDQTGVEAYIDEYGVSFKTVENASTGVTIQKGTSNFYTVAVSASGSSVSNIIRKSIGSIEGFTNTSVLEGLTDGVITIGTEKICYNSGMTIGEIIDAINTAAAETGNITRPYQTPEFAAGLDEQGRFFIKTDLRTSATGNIWNLTGFRSGVSLGNAELEIGYDEEFSTLKGVNDVNVNSDVSSGDFYINYNGSSKKITVGDNETIQSVMDKISGAGLGLTATIQNGKVVITADDANSKRIYITDGTSNFSELAGFTSEGAQSGATVQGADSVYTSANTALSAQGTYSDGDFYIHLTDTDGNITDTERINIDASDSIQYIINRINTSSAGVTAYIDELTGKLAIQRNSSEEAGGVLVTKGTSDFTNKIGFTSGGEQNVETVAGSQAELVSQNTATNASFSSGNFIIQMTDVDGNVTSEHTFDVSAGDSAQKIAQMITDADIGLTAYIDNATGKMVIKRNTDSGEGGFLVQKGTSDFTTVMNFTSGGYEIGVKQDGETASVTSLYNVSSAGSFTAGTFYIDGTEITITDADINSGNAVQAVLDKITSLTDVIASLDNQNRIVLTKKASAGEGEIEIVKGSSNFTNKFGFTSGGYQTATATTGTLATISSSTTSYSTQYSAGDFYLQLTGDNATDPVKVTISEGDNAGSIIDKINALDMGITASWDSSTNKIVLTRDGEKGEGGINVIKGTSDFTNLVGFTSGGQQDPATVNGVTASITSNNQVTPSTAVTKGDFIIKFDGVEHVIELTEDTTIDAVLDKINDIDGLNAVYNDSTKKITITRDGASGDGNFEIIKGTSNFTTVAGFTSGGSQSTSAVRGTKGSITSTTAVNNTQKFTQGDFVINLTGENAASINVSVDTNDTVLTIVNKINALDAGVTARYDNTTGLITISRDSETGDGNIEIVKGSSNFTQVVGFTQGGSSSATFVDGDYAEITAQQSASANQHFGAGDFTIKLTGDNASSVNINVTADDTIQSIIDKINAADAGVTAYLNDDNKLVIKRDAGTGTGGIEIVKGSSSFTSDIGLTTGGTEYSGVKDSGDSAKIVSTQTIATAQGSYTSGNFFIQLLDKNGNAETDGLIKVDINKSGNTIDDINTIINTINAKNAGITASVENGKLVLTRDENLDAGSFVVLKGTSDFTNVIGLTTGGSLETGVYEAGDAATHTVLTSQDLGKKLVSDSMTLGSIGVKTGTFRINGVDINVKTSDTIYDLVTRINSVFSDSKYEDIAVTASYENGEMVLRSREASSTARVVVERGTSNFTDIANFTNSYQNSTDLGILNEGHNAHFTLNGKEYDMALDLNDITDDNVYNGNNLIYLDADGNVVTDSDDASITIEVKQTGNTTIDIGRNLLNDSVQKLQSFVNRFNTAMNASSNQIMSDDTEFAAFINQIKSALTSNIGSMNKITQKLAEIGIIVKVTGGSNSNMGSVEMSLSKTNGQYDYVEAFYKDPQKVMDLIIGDDSSPLDYSVAGAFTRLSDTLHYALENNRGGYFKVTPRSLEAQQKALKREITKTTFELNELKNTASGDNGMQGLSEYLLQLEQQYQMINEAITALNKQYSSSMARLVLNQNNASFNPIVS